MITIPHLHDFLTNLPEQLRHRVYERARERRVSKGDSIYRQGEKPTEWFQIVTGLVKLSSYSKEGGELVALELHEGDCFGEMGVIDGLPRISHAIATKDTTLRVWSRTEFDALNAEYPDFNAEIMRVLAYRVRLAYCLWIEASGLSLRERLAIALCRLAYTIAGDPAQSDIPISQEGLGQMLGASRQTVNKELQQLASAQLISLHYGKIRVTNLPELEARYGQLVGAEPVAASYQPA